MDRGLQSNKKYKYMTEREEESSCINTPPL